MTAPRDGEWMARGEATPNSSDWVGMHLADVVLRNGTRVDHHVVRMPRPAAGTVIVAEGRDAVCVGGPVDRNEAAPVEWLPADGLRDMPGRGEIADGPSFGALADAPALGELP